MHLSFAACLFTAYRYDILFASRIPSNNFYCATANFCSSAKSNASHALPQQQFYSVCNNQLHTLNSKTVF